MNKKITIGIDASRSIDSIQKTGVEFVSDELLKQFINFKKEIIKYIFYTPEYISWLPRESQKVLNWPFRFLWTQIRLSLEMLIQKPDIYFSPVHTLPYFCPKKTFKIIHDVAFKKNKKLYNFKNRILLNFDLCRAIKKCEKIFVPTQQVKNDLLKFTKISENKIIVIPHGYTKKTSAFAPKKSYWTTADRQKHKNTKTLFHKKKQILYIGRIEEKKNILNLIKAFEIFNKKYPDYKLILAGKIDQKYFDKNIKYQILKIKNKIFFLGYVSEEKKYKLLSESVCLAFVPFEEGFGIPILEAFDFNLPVVCSDIPVLQEVGGEACIFVNSSSPQEISGKIEKIISDKNLKNNLIQKGEQQLEKFSWKKAGEKYLQEILK